MINHTLMTELAKLIQEKVPDFQCLVLINDSEGNPYTSLMIHYNNKAEVLQTMMNHTAGMTMEDMRPIELNNN